MSDDLTVKPRSLDSEQLMVIAWIEQYWHSQSAFPSKRSVEKEFPDFDLAENLKHETFLLALSNRGIQTPSERGLTDEQVAAILTVINYEDKRSRNAKLKSLGITPTRWSGWLRNKQFKEFLHQMSSSNFEDSLHAAQEGLLRSVDKGDVNAIKFYFEVTGRYSTSNVTEQNFRLTVARIVESVQRHVKDPEIIKEIASDFEIIMRGDSPPVGQIEPAMRSL